MRVTLRNSLFLLMSCCVFMLVSCDKDVATQQVEPVAKVESAQQLPKLLDLGAHKCVACKKMTPVLDELSKEYAGVFDVEFIDVWQPENEEKATGYGIESIPTQIFFDADGKELWRHVGFISKEDVLKKWMELGFAFDSVQPQNASAEPACVESE